MAMEYNKSPISLREGHIYIDGVEVADGVKCNIKFTPDVWTGQQLGEHGYSSRWLNYKITGDVTRRRSTNFLKEKIQEYKDSGITPEMTIQGVMDDAGSDYYQDYGTDTVTCVGCVLTGDLPLTVLDSGGDVVEDTIAFNAKDVIF
ncbi:MAG: phage tail tube protein [Clostridiales bacterium]|nr:phage tail tube protein [Clostridiales bacterium]